ncbi:nuclear transport factor 2 family protein [Streptomyces sp. NPDC102360]|uniref:nuclear transport factor 2 family protein n=1 Tax=Streptomyces sp. NPDC102360 TaxID=3366160 RepID=UPI00381B4D1F
MTTAHDKTDQTTLEQLERRLSLVEAKQDIITVLYRMAQTVDYGEHPAWLDCFTDDIEFQMVEVSSTDRVVRVRHEGHQALRDFIPGHTHAPEHFHKHLVGDPIVEVEGDLATASSYLTRIDHGETGPYFWSFGRYLDTFRRCDDGKWRVTTRVIEVESRAAPVKKSDIGAKK